MKESLEEALNWEPHRLFTGKACHVFADQLMTRLRSKGWQFFRIGLKDIPVLPGQQFMSALHVCLGNGACFLDICGQHNREELLGTWRKEWPQLSDINIYSCTREDLFEKSQLNVQTGDLARLPDFLRKPEVLLAFEQQSAEDKYSLALDHEFLARAGEKAIAVIQRDPAKYGLESFG